MSSLLPSVQSELTNESDERIIFDQIIHHGRGCHSISNSSSLASSKHLTYPESQVNISTSLMPATCCCWYPICRWDCICFGLFVDLVGKNWSETHNLKLSRIPINPSAFRFDFTPMEGGIDLWQLSWSATGCRGANVLRWSVNQLRWAANILS